MDATRVPQPHRDDHDDHDDTLEAHYASLERASGACPLCFGGYVTITVEEDGQEHDEAVPCRRCSESR